MYAVLEPINEGCLLAFHTWTCLPPNFPSLFYYKLYILDPAFKEGEIVACKKIVGNFELLGLVLLDID